MNREPYKWVHFCFLLLLHRVCEELHQFLFLFLKVLYYILYSKQLRRMNPFLYKRDHLHFLQLLRREYDREQHLPLFRLKALYRNPYSKQLRHKNRLRYMMREHCFQQREHLLYDLLREELFFILCRIRKP